MIRHLSLLLFFCLVLTSCIHQLPDITEAFPDYALYLPEELGEETITLIKKGEKETVSIEQLQQEQAFFLLPPRPFHPHRAVDKINKTTIDRIEEAQLVPNSCKETHTIEGVELEFRVEICRQGPILAQSNVAASDVSEYTPTLIRPLAFTLYDQTELVDQIVCYDVNVLVAGRMTCTELCPAEEFFFCSFNSYDGRFNTSALYPEEGNGDITNVSQTSCKCGEPCPTTCRPNPHGGGPGADGGYIPFRN